MEKQEAILYQGCGMLLDFTKYIVYANGTTKQIKNENEFRDVFAPVENEKEALAFAALLSTSYPLESVDLPEGYIQMSESLKPTWVKLSGESFLVRLFNYECHGCGMHPYYAVEYSIDKLGNIIEVGREDLYRNPADDNRCTD